MGGLRYSRNGYTRIGKTLAKQLYGRGIPIYIAYKDVVPSNESVSRIPSKSGGCTEYEFETSISLYENFKENCGIYLYARQEDNHKRYQVKEKYGDTYIIDSYHFPNTNHMKKVTKSELISMVKNNEITLESYRIDYTTNKLISFREIRRELKKCSK